MPLVLVSHILNNQQEIGREKQWPQPGDSTHLPERNISSLISRALIPLPPTPRAVARDYIESGQADGVVVVCDATCLERNLILVLQVMELTGKVLVCVNLLDEAERLGIRVDLSALSQRLGVPVVGTAAGRQTGLDDLKAAIAQLVRADASAAPERAPVSGLLWRNATLLRWCVVKRRSVSAASSAWTGY